MEQFLNHLPIWITTFGATIPVIVLGGLAVIGITDRKARERAKDRVEEQNQLQDNIRKLYQEEAKAQDEKIRDQAMKIKEVSERLATVEGENKMMRSLLQGRDGDSLEYRKRVEATLSLVDKLAEVIMTNGKKTDAIMESIQTTNKNIERVARAIAKKN